MKDQEHLQFCLYQIEQKLGWGESKSWKENEFLRLSEIVYKETEISISSHTLKRLYGKIKYKEDYNPQRATKDALAKYIGFSDWIAYQKHYDEEIHNEPEMKIKHFEKRKKIKFGIIVTGLLLLLLLTPWSVVMKTLINQKDNGSFSFHTSDTLATVPHTVSVNYNIENVASDSVFLDFNFEHPVTGPEIKKLDKQRSNYNYTYQIPGYYKITLNTQGQELASKKILVASDDWFSFYFSEDKQDLWLNNQIKSSRKNGYLYYSPESLISNGLDINSVFYVNHRFFKQFDIDGDNFEMNLRFKNSKETAGITCFDFVLTLYCEKEISHIKLMEMGCSSYSGVKVGELEINGVDEDLTALTFDPTCWNNLDVVVKENTIQVLMNKKLVLSRSYKGSNGNIVGIEQKFKGTGMLDYISLTDLDTQKEYFDDFDDGEK